MSMNVNVFLCHVNSVEFVDGLCVCVCVCARSDEDGSSANMMLEVTHRSRVVELLIDHVRVCLCFILYVCVCVCTRHVQIAAKHTKLIIVQMNDTR